VGDQVTLVDAHLLGDTLHDGRLRDERVVATRRLVRQPEAREVESNEAPMRHETGDVAPVVRGTGEAVEREDRFALAGCPCEDATAVDVDVPPAGLPLLKSVIHAA
jgi:hypothetical protein